VPAFAALAPGLADAVLDGLLERRVLWDDAGVLWLDRARQDRYGRRHVRDLCAVFMAAPEFTVRHGREHLGSVAEDTFRARAAGGQVLLLLAGRSWPVTAVDWPARRAFVEPAGSGGRSVWQGEGQFLGRPLCRAVQEVLAGADESPAWTHRARDQVAIGRAVYPWVDAASPQIVAGRGGRVEWWTVGGGRANAALACAVARRLGTAAAADNFAVRFPDAAPVSAADVVEDLRRPGPGEVRACVDPRAVAGLNDADGLGSDLSEAVAGARADDPTAVAEGLAAPVRTAVTP
jgi:ATP-dependent Lhr-like helicase